MPAAASAAILGRLGFTLRDEGGHWQVQAPSHRVDVTCKQDLVEEIIRIHGYDHLQAEMPLTANPLLRLDRERDDRPALEKPAGRCRLQRSDQLCFSEPGGKRAVRPPVPPLTLKNPLGKDFSVMKNSLLAGLLRNTAFNANQGMERVALFEIGKVFGRQAGRVRGEQAAGRQRLWTAAEKGLAPAAEQHFDFSCFKSLLALLGRRLRLEFAFEKHAHPAYADACCFAVEIDGRRLRLARRSRPGVPPLLQAGAAGLCRRARPGRPAVRGRAREAASATWNRFPAVAARFHLPDGQGDQLRGVERRASSVCGRRCWKVSN